MQQSSVSLHVVILCPAEQLQVCHSMAVMLGKAAQEAVSRAVGCWSSIQGPMLESSLGWCHLSLYTVSAVRVCRTCWTSDSGRLSCGRRTGTPKASGTTLAACPGRIACSPTGAAASGGPWRRPCVTSARTSLQALEILLSRGSRVQNMAHMPLTISTC